MSIQQKAATIHKARSKFELWQDTINLSSKDSRWNSYDCDIKRVVGEYNQHLLSQGHYRPLNWRLIKAMIWTESGGPDNRAWRRNPMQIGNPGDPGLRALLSKDEGGTLILPPSVAKGLSESSALTSPLMNIRAGTGYLLMRMARFGIANVVDETAVVSVVEVRRGDTFSKIAHDNGSTVGTLKMLNQGILTLSPGEAIKCQKASMRKIIVGWELITTAHIASRYNVGDPTYAKKLNYCLAAMKMVPEGTACAA